MNYKVFFAKNNHQETDDFMFPDEFLVLNDPKFEASSELRRKSSANFVNLRRSSKNAWKRSYGLRTTLGQFSV